MKLITALVAACLMLATSLDAQGQAEDQKKLTEEVTRLTEALAKTPDSIRLLSQRGDANLFLGKFKESVADFEKTIALDPAQDAPHWRLGIAYYFAGDFKKSSKQFAKYHAYDGRDRENGVWKFLADAKLEGMEKARGAMLEYTQFDREPFPSLYEMFAGKKASEAVLTELAGKGLPKDGAAAFFANYYVALNADLLGRRERARELIAKAVASGWGKTAEGGPAYMWRVARLHAAELNRPAPTKP
jgi:lipoprotein NlpI